MLFLLLPAVVPPQLAGGFSAASSKSELSLLSGGEGAAQKQPRHISAYLPEVVRVLCNTRTNANGLANHAD